MSKKPQYHFENLNKADQECLSLVESLGIYELRALARVFGDNSPTVQKRDGHIKFVMDKIIAREDLKPIPLRAGRPYKELSNIEGILEEISRITGKDYTLNKSFKAYGSNATKKSVSFNQIEDKIYSKKSCPLEVCGIVCENGEQYMLTDTCGGKSILVKKDAGVRPFDYISGTAVLMNNHGEYILDTIKQINYQDIKTYTAKPYTYQLEVPSENLNKTNLLLGSRYILKDISFSESTTEFKNFVKRLNSQNIITLALIPNAPYENTIAVNEIGFSNVFMTKYEDSPFATSELIDLFIKHVARLQELGLKVAIFAENITSFANSVDCAHKTSAKSTMGHTEMAVNLTKKLIMLAKASGKEVHTTLFTTLDISDMFDPLYVAYVYKVSKEFEI